jgi:hypothetical protein
MNFPNFRMLVLHRLRVFDEFMAERSLTWEGTPCRWRSPP